MWPVPQTKFRDEHGEGNSLQACLASIFERPLDTVPDFRVAWNDDVWWTNLQEWLQLEYGVWLLPVELERARKHVVLGWHMIVGMTAHGRQVVVGHNGQPVHDPHPGGEGLLKEEHLYVFVRTFEGGPTAAEREDHYEVSGFLGGT